MYQIIQKIARKRLIILDGAALFAAYLIALGIRYGVPYRVEEWQVSAYAMAFALMLPIYILIYHFYDGKRPPIMEQDVFDVFLSVVKNAILLNIVLLGSLYLVKSLASLSRLVFGIAFLLFQLFDFLLRCWYRRRKIRFLDLTDRPGNTLLITRAEYEGMIRGRISLDPHAAEITDTILLDKEPDYAQYEKRSYRSALIYLPEGRGYDDPLFQCFLDALSSHGTRLLKILCQDGVPVERDLISSLSGLEAVQIPTMAQRGNVLGVNFCVSNPVAATLYVRMHLDALRSHYVTFCNVHTTMESCKDPSYQKIQNSAALTFPDGAPIAKQLQRMEFADARRVAGPDFMDAMFRSSMDGKITHYFYGASPEAIRRLQECLPKRYPGIVIKGLYSPPYRPLTKEEDEAVMREINSSGADLIWIGLGAPKQEKWMASHEGKLHGVMFGMDAGFDFYAGTMRRAPKWMQRLGLEWLYRLFSDPKRLFRRYFVSNLQYLWAIYMPHCHTHSENTKAADRKNIGERCGTVK